LKLTNNLILQYNSKNKRGKKCLDPPINTNYDKVKLEKKIVELEAKIASMEHHQ